MSSGFQLPAEPLHLLWCLLLFLQVLVQQLHRFLVPHIPRQLDQGLVGADLVALHLGRNISVTPRKRPL